MMAIGFQSSEKKIHILPAWTVRVASGLLVWQPLGRKRHESDFLPISYYVQARPFRLIKLYFHICSVYSYHKCCFDRMHRDSVSSRINL